MPRRPRTEPLSPRAAARLRTPRGGWVPSVRELGPAGHGPPARELGPASHGPRPQDPSDGVGGEGPPWARAGPHRPEDDVEVGSDREGDVDLPGDHDDGFDASPRRGPARWFRLPVAFVGARWEPSGRAVLGLALAVAVAVLLFGLRVGWASSEGTVLAPGGGSRAGPSGLSAGSVPVGADAGSAAGAGASPTGVPSPSGAPGTAGGVVVHVVGQVRRPGLQRLPPGSRVADAVEAAGGATSRADLARVNLARVLVDGEQVLVPAPGDPDPPGAAAAGGSAGVPSGGGKVSINTADLAGLDTLPGVGPVLAQRILDWRSAHGRFTSVDELGEVSGIGEKVLENLRPLVTL
ncbi:helix-hairpin-helix domain-containing protein [Oryzobacter sp. R7]|uniref:helix-hairpin-helix domain-containing protein n=1 Tax=Oryzobacter faecalis TaxID=3388656 RepID=UPI00398CE80F